MSLSVATNTSAAMAHRLLKRNDAEATSSMAKLSSGSRIVRASDDAASLAVGVKIKADVAALRQAQVNASHGVSVLQVADGGLSQITDILTRMKALSVQAQSGSVGNEERGFIDKEFQGLRTQIDDIARQTKFNGVSLINGTYNAATTIDATNWTDPAVSNGTNGEFGLIAGIHTTDQAAAGTYTLTWTDVVTAPPGSEAPARMTLTAGALTETIDLGTDETVTGPFNGNATFANLGITLDLNAFDPSTAKSANADFTIEETPMSFQLGVQTEDAIDFRLPDVTTRLLGGAAIADRDGVVADRYLADAGDGAVANVSTMESAAIAGNILDEAISRTVEARAEVGAVTSRFEFAGANLDVSVENLDAARSVLMDVDMAAEMANFSSKQVVMQASVSMLAQANQMPQNLLKLLG